MNITEIFHELLSSLALASVLWSLNLYSLIVFSVLLHFTLKMTVEETDETFGINNFGTRNYSPANQNFNNLDADRESFRQQFYNLFKI